MENNNRPQILDSGDRTEFASGAVRDMREGKGRCDLLPLDVVAEYFFKLCGDKNPTSTILGNISRFMTNNDLDCLFKCLNVFINDIRVKFDSPYTMFLEVAKHFEEGAKKYGENNWQKGIPVRCYIDSAIRHYFKWLRCDHDEPHDKAFCWNIICAIWTCKNKPELNDYRKEDTNG